jgi:hypothetical protein
LRVIQVPGVCPGTHNDQAGTTAKKKKKLIDGWLHLVAP